MAGIAAASNAAAITMRRPAGTLELAEFVADPADDLPPWVDRDRIPELIVLGGVVLVVEHVGGGNLEVPGIASVEHSQVDFESVVEQVVELLAGGRTVELPDLAALLVHDT